MKRVKLKDCVAVYHVVNRTCCREKYLGAEEKEVFRRMLLRQAAFCGLEVLTFCFMDNHFHILVRVPPLIGELCDEELLRRHRFLYGGQRVPCSALRTDELASLLEQGGWEADRWRDKLHRRMGDLSVFMRELKQRFAIWFNQQRGNRGTIWAEPFWSVLIDDDHKDAQMQVAAYIDANAISAGIAKSVDEYPWTGMSSRRMDNFLGYRHIVRRMAERARCLEEEARECYEARINRWGVYKLGKQGQPDGPVRTLGGEATVMGSKTFVALVRQAYVLKRESESAAFSDDLRIKGHRRWRGH